VLHLMRLSHCGKDFRGVNVSMVELLSSKMYLWRAGEAVLELTERACTHALIRNSAG
jgi:hypothetical protein